MKSHYVYVRYYRYYDFSDEKKNFISKENINKQDQ